MRDNTTDNKYEQLYTQLLERGEYLHERNKKRIRIGLAGLVVLPFILGLMIRITGSSKIAFLIIWIIWHFLEQFILLTYISRIVKKEFKYYLTYEIFVLAIVSFLYSNFCFYIILFHMPNNKWIFTNFYELLLKKKYKLFIHN